MPRLFPKGHSGNPDGRPKGSRNKVSREIREAARQLVESPAYLTSLKKRLLQGKALHMEPLLFYYAYGKPVERIAPTDPSGTQPYHPASELSVEELRTIVRAIKARQHAG